MCDPNSLTDVKELLDRAKSIVSKFEDALGWKDCSTKLETFKVCPYNNSHRIAFKSFENHLKRCKWRNFGYKQDEVDEILEAESSAPLGPTISIDEIVAKVSSGTKPLRNHEVYVSTLSTDERLQVYNGILSQLKQNKQNLEDPFLYRDLDEKSQQTTSGSTNKTNIELIKELRDHKRRRQSYRAKNVHVTKRSQTEVLRDILSIHMEDLRLRWNPDLRLKSEEDSVIDQVGSKPVIAEKQEISFVERNETSRWRRKRSKSRSPREVGGGSRSSSVYSERRSDKKHKHHNSHHKSHKHDKRSSHDHKHKKHKRHHDDDDNEKRKKHKKSSY